MRAREARISPGPSTFRSLTGREATTAALLAMFVSAFYLLTLAPSVLWGDDAFFQRAAVEGVLPPAGNDHWIWLQLARLFTTIPVGNMAFRVNLLSAAAAVGTILVVYCVVRTLGLGRGAGVAAALSLTVAHTFWTHAVRAEVYTVFTLLMAIQLWLWFRWREGEPVYLHAAAGLFGLTLLGHQMAVLLLPAAAVLIWMQRRWLAPGDSARLSMAFVLGLCPFLYVMVWDIGARTGGSLARSIYLYFTHAGSMDYSGSFLDFSLDKMGRDGMLWLGFLGLQFVGLAAVAGLAGATRVWRKGVPSPAWLSVSVLYATTAMFAMSYRVNDHFAFFLPSYLAAVLFVAAGWNQVESHSRRVLRARWAAYPVLVLVPVATLYVLPHTINALGVNPLGVRQLPGREANRFFLWPAKNGYFGAEQYGRGALESASPDGVILADHTPSETLRYLQQIEGVHPDVTVMRVPAGADLAPYVQRLASETRIFLADNDARYYNLSGLPEASLTPVGNIYLLGRLGHRANQPKRRSAFEAAPAS